MDKRFLLILAALAVIFVGIFWYSKTKNIRATGNTNPAASSHVQGNNTTGVELVEYGDYQCPACAQFYPIVKQVVASHADQISFRFANFPLVQTHPNAMATARAAEAASLQGKFWEMHDLLYQNQQAWSSAPNLAPFLEQYAKQLGLDLNKFRTDQASSKVLDTINADVSQVQALNGTGTPTFVLNGKKIDNNPTSLEAFNKLIDDAIKNAKQ